MLKRKSKTEKGITLIALIITIVVLLILAVVAISSIQNDGIIGKATDTSKHYNDAVANEQTILDTYLNYLNSNGQEIGGNTPSQEGIVLRAGETKASEKQSTNSTINGGAYSATNPIIPAGFMAVNTATSKWTEGNLAEEVKKGLVITDGTNEFVWIPVADINEMVKVTSGKDANGRTNYEGKLYDFTSTGATEKTNYGQSTTSYREPANLTGQGYYDDNSDKQSKFTTIEWTEDYYQKAFNKMVESVAEYKGFYVGRYEMSLSSAGKAQSKAGEVSSNASNDATNMWYGLYEKAKTYTNNSVTSEMIWGCQYDAMMRWMEENGIDVASETPKDISRNVTASRNETRTTGAQNSNDILNNIYDILGNSFEWTQEAYDTDTRVPRGGRIYGSNSPSYRYYFCDYPTLTNDLYGSRLSLYVGL